MSKDEDIKEILVDLKISFPALRVCDTEHLKELLYAEATVEDAEDLFSDMRLVDDDLYMSTREEIEESANYRAMGSDMVAYTFAFGPMSRGVDYDADKRGCLSDSVFMGKVFRKKCTTTRLGVDALDLDASENTHMFGIYKADPNHRARFEEIVASINEIKAEMVAFMVGDDE